MAGLPEPGEDPAKHGVHVRVSRSPSGFGDYEVGIGIVTQADLPPVVLRVPRRLSPISYRTSETPREIIESLIEQLNRQLAVETLEGR